MVAPPLKRLSRPTWVPLPALKVTDRHTAIIQAVAQARFLTSEQISRKVGGSHQKNLRLLHKLWLHAYLDRPKQQHGELAAFFDEGNRPLVYGLARRGARLLAALGMAVNPNLDWTTKNKRATAEFLAHTIDVADVMHAFERAIRDRTDLTLLDHHQLLPFMPARTQEMRNPFALKISVRDHRSDLPIPVVPDRLFSISKNAFALERDRGQMSIGNKASKLSKTSYRRKLIGYWQAVQSGMHTEQWGFSSFRILTVTTSTARIANMIAAQREATNAPPGLFLYSTPQLLAQHGALGPAWITSNRENIALFP